LDWRDIRVKDIPGGGPVQGSRQERLNANEEPIEANMNGTNRLGWGSR
jgi:hypothetical protein